MKFSMPKAIQVTIFILFALALVAMSCGATIVPKDPETQKLFYVILGIFTTLLSVQTLTAAIQREDGFAPMAAPPSPPATVAEEPVAPPAAGGEAGFAKIRLLGALTLGLLLFGAVGCATPRHATNGGVPDAIVTAQETAEKVVYGFTAAFQATPPIVDALLKNGTITPHTYNTEILPAYNKGLASLKVLTSALKAAENANADPNHVETYTVALARFLEDKALLDSILTAYGKKGE